MQQKDNLRRGPCQATQLVLKNGRQNETLGGGYQGGGSTKKQKMIARKNFPCEGKTKIKVKVKSSLEKARPRGGMLNVRIQFREKRERKVKGKGPMHTGGALYVDSQSTTEQGPR